MTRRKRSIKQANLVKMQLADIIQDVFDNNGQLVTHEVLAKRHVLRNGSTSADEDVRIYGGPAVVYLRNELHYAIVPVTHSFHDFDSDTDDETVIANSVAGLGAGGARIGWYHPASKDDWLWVYYVGHLGRSGVMAIFHAGEQDRHNPQLLTAEGRTRVATHAVDTLPAPSKIETKVLVERLEQK